MFSPMVKAPLIFTPGEEAELKEARRQLKEEELRQQRQEWGMDL